MARSGTSPERFGVGQPEGALLLALVHLGLRRLEPLDPLVEGLGDPGPAVGAAPHRVGQGGEPLDLPALEQCRPLPLALVGLELDHVGRVGPLELVQPAVGQVEHLVDRAVEQLEVVGDDQDGPGEALELLHQPPLGREVEVVGGLVEDHGVRPLEEDPDQVDPAALAAREALDVLEQELLAETEAVGQAGHGRLGLVAAVLPELLLEIGEELDVLGRRVLAHLGAGLVEGVVEDVEAPPGQDVGEAVGLEPEAVLDRDLGQIAERAPDP